MGSTSGYYKEHRGGLLCAPNRVTLPGQSLSRNPTADQKLQEQTGWFWFDSRPEALKHFGITEDADTTCLRDDCPDRVLPTADELEANR